MRVILQGIVGSQAYGLSTPQSDVDRLGVWQAPTRDILRLNPPEESIVERDPLPDRTLHEVGKFVRLALANNPTILELLWLTDFEVGSHAGKALVDIRQSFLSQRVRKTYGGYAIQQLERLKRREEAEPGSGFSADLKKRTEKHGRHCYRLLIQGMAILQEGHLRVRLTDDEAQRCREAGALAAKDVEGFERMMRSLMDDFDSTTTDLPPEPDRALVDDLLVELRLKDLR